MKSHRSPTGRRKGFAVSKPEDTKPNINVTPLIDVVLVMLIIFMVVAPLLEKSIVIETPKQEQVDTQDDVPNEQLVVHVKENGFYQLKGEDLNLADLSGVLTKRLEGKKDADRIVFVTADEKAIYANLVDAFDVVNTVKAHIGFATEESPKIDVVDAKPTQDTAPE